MKWVKRLAVVTVVLTVTVSLDLTGYAIGYWHGSRGEVYIEWDHHNTTGDMDRPAVYRGWVDGVSLFNYVANQSDGR